MRRRTYVLFAALIVVWLGVGVVLDWSGIFQEWPIVGNVVASLVALPALVLVGSLTIDRAIAGDAELASRRSLRIGVGRTVPRVIWLLQEIEATYSVATDESRSAAPLTPDLAKTLSDRLTDQLDYQWAARVVDDDHPELLPEATAARVRQIAEQLHNLEEVGGVESLLARVDSVIAQLTQVVGTILDLEVLRSHPHVLDLEANYQDSLSHYRGALARWSQSVRRPDRARNLAVVADPVVRTVTTDQLVSRAAHQAFYDEMDSVRSLVAIGWFVADHLDSDAERFTHVRGDGRLHERELRKLPPGI